jgi:hypothetical protein
VPAMTNGVGLEHKSRAPEGPYQESNHFSKRSIGTRELATYLDCLERAGLALSRSLAKQVSETRARFNAIIIIDGGGGGVI